MRKQAIVNGKRTNYTVDTDGHVYDQFDNELHQTNFQGYRVVYLMLYGKSTQVRVHRIVCETFLQNPENKPFVNHIDGCKSNNKLSNLEWVTPKENSRHAVRTGLIVNALRPETVHDICKVMESGLYTTRQVSDMFNVPIGTISAIKNKHEWVEISDLYEVEECRNEKVKTPEFAVRQICELLEQNDLTMIEIAEKVGVNKVTVGDIYYGRQHKRISEEYDFSNYDKIDRSHVNNKRDKEYFEKIRSYMRMGYTNKEIISMMNLEKCGATNNLLFRQRKIVEKETVGS